MVKRLLDVLKVRDDTILNFLRQFHVFHGGVGCVDLSLELCRLLVEVRNDQCHVTKDVGVDDGADRDGCRHESYLESATGQDVIPCQQQDGMVQRDEVLVGEGRIVKVGIRVDVVEGRLPLLVDGHDDVPETRQAVDVDYDHEDELEELKGILHILSHIHSLNDATEARDTHEFQQGEKLQDGVGRVRKDGDNVVEGDS